MCDGERKQLFFSCFLTKSYASVEQQVYHAPERNRLNYLLLAKLLKRDILF